MAIRTGGRLLDQFRERLRECDAADVAVAWAAPCPAVDELREFCGRGGELRIVVGVAGNATHPTTLRDLYRLAKLRIGVAAPTPGGIFHPKYYCFRRGSRSTVWIGSANLTRGGFGGNNELMLENAGTKDSREWFELLWSSLVADPGNEIATYERNWKPPAAGGRGRTGVGRTSQKKRGTALERLDASWSWDDFVNNLRAKDEEMLAAGLHDGEGKPEEPWTVFGDYRSWMHTISVGRPVTRLRSWRNLELWQAEILVGRTPWGALGTLKGAGKACSMIMGDAAADRDARQDIRQHVRATTRAGIEVIGAAVQAVNAITKHPRVGVGVATRLLALARPDCYVSLNGASRGGLAACSGLAPTTIDKRYDELLHWVHESNWYGAPQPSDSNENEIWDCRAALIDAFVYDAR